MPPWTLMAAGRHKDFMQAHGPPSTLMMSNTDLSNELPDTRGLFYGKINTTGLEGGGISVPSSGRSRVPTG